MSIDVTAEREKPKSDAEAKAFLHEVIDAEINRFSEVLASRSDGHTISGFEREILRAYLWWRLVG